MSAAVRRKREIESPPKMHQEGRAGGANDWIRTGTTVPDSDSRGVTAALALPAQNRKTNIWSGGHWRTSADIHRVVNDISPNPLQRLDSEDMSILNYASKIPEINDSDP